MISWMEPQDKININSLNSTKDQPKLILTSTNATCKNKTNSLHRQTSQEPNLGLLIKTWVVTSYST